MKKFYTTVWIILMMICSINSQDFYDINTINTIEITFEESNWDYLLDQLVSAGDEERLMGSVSVNGQEFDSVGVRYKGNSSYNSNQVKNPLNIKLDYIIDDQEIEGYGTLKLANVYKDPSFVREVLGYEIARKYFPASQSNYANVYINGTHLGLYTSDQDVDKFFMRTHFNSDENPRVKGEISGNLPPGSMGGVWEYFGTDSTDYYEKFTMESDFGWQELVWFLDTLNNSTEDVEKVLNIDRHLWFLAFSNLLVNLDGPINNPQNHYIYKDDNGQFNPIPWDLNESFGVFTMLQSSGPLSTTQLQQLSPFVNLNESDYPIINKILSDATYRKIYVAHMKTMMEENFENDWYETRALEIQNIIANDVSADNNKFYSYSDFLNNINSSVGGGPPPNSSVIGITQLMDARVNYINTLTDFQYDGPEITNVSSSPEEVVPNETVWITAEVVDGNDVYLAYRTDQYSVFTKIEMFDDGNHEDGAVNDGVYGIDLTTGYSEIQYYIYAENTNAVSFYPVRAEYEFLTVDISFETGDVVINELMADNETTVVDQNGEYDDWIEFYNKGDEDVNLAGSYLTDDENELDQWIFPDVTISAGGYLIVWADNDVEQDGLHANFKLSSAGETLIFSNNDLIPLDETVFSEQSTDISFGRYPNGTGDFIYMIPTFEAENINEIILVEDVVINEFMAENESTATDQDGEYDDWIELYNKGDEDVNLAGCYLTDDENELSKWTFPDVTISAGGYLIVWADNDVEQDGLHANFKLSSAGETLILSNSNLMLLDETVFTEQEPDISFGRYPNGTGDFIFMVPTFSEENTNQPIGVEEELVSENGFILKQNRPNPAEDLTSIDFILNEGDFVSLNVYNSYGNIIRSVHSGWLPEGEYSFSVNTTELAEGLYFYSLEAGNKVQYMKMMVQ